MSPLCAVRRESLAFNLGGKETSVQNDSPRSVPRRVSFDCFDGRGFCSLDFRHGQNLVLMKDGRPPVPAIENVVTRSALGRSPNSWHDDERTPCDRRSSGTVECPL